MSDNERNIAMEANPYDHLMEHVAEPVKSPVILANIEKTEQNRCSKEPVQIVPLASEATHEKITVIQCTCSNAADLEVEEDVLVPDTFPDVEMILNMNATVTSSELYNDKDTPAIKGSLKLETMYRSAEAYGNNIAVVPATIEFNRQLKELAECAIKSPAVTVKVQRVENSLINERKYRARVHLQISADNNNEKELLLFKGLEGEKLHTRKEKIRYVPAVTTKRKDSEISEDLLINDEKIRPVKILKSQFTIAENHQQLTGEKLILNQTIWVRILYLAEIASKGNLSNMPVFFQGKIDNTQFVPFGKNDSAVSGFTLCSNADELAAEINRESNGFRIYGDIHTDINLYSSVEKEIVTDFYHDKEEMTCDWHKETVCTGVETVCIDHILRENISLQHDDGMEPRIIYLDAEMIEIQPAIHDDTIEVKGKVLLSAITMNEGDYTVVGRKICDFTAAKELAAGKGSYAVIKCAFVREMSSDMIGAGGVNITAQMQVQVTVYNEENIPAISNPCFVRSDTDKRNYPIIIHTVKEGEDSWSIGKKYKVAEESITAINGSDSIRPGNKIIIVK